MHFATKRMRIQKDMIVKVNRVLMGKGKFSVSVGQELEPHEIIGKGEFSGGFTTLNLSNALGVSPSEIVRYLKSKVGLRIYKGELLAYRSSSLFRKERFVTCPIDGILDFINNQTGEIRITRLPQKIDLPAGVYGVVENVDHAHGQVSIRTQVSRVFGVCGSGRVRDGILHILTRRISPKLDGTILVSRSLISKEGIMAAISNSVNGIITGGINASDYKSVAGGRLVFPKKIENDIGVSIVVCEGFGSEALGEDIYELLSKYEDKFVQIDGNKALINLPSFESSCMIKIRKTKVPPSEVVPFGETQVVELSLGQTVRVVGLSYSAEQGKIIAIDRSLTLLPSGIRAYLATIETRRRKIKVPINNIEVIA